MLDMKKLVYLESVYRHKNFTRASEELFVSQPTISAAIRSLEDEFCLTFVRRNSKEVSFTYEGELFITLARRVLEECKNLEAEMNRLAFSNMHTLKIGLSPSLSMPVLSKLFIDFFPKYPDVKISIDEGAMYAQIDKILNGTIDISFNALPNIEENPSLKTIPIGSSKVMAIMRPDNPLANRETITISELSKNSIAILEKSMLSTIVFSLFREHNVAPSIISTHEQFNYMFEMVRKCNYVGFLSTDPGLDIITTLSSDLIARPIEGNPSFMTGFFMRSNMNLLSIHKDLIALFIDFFNSENAKF